MAQQPESDSSEVLRQKLVCLLTDFKEELKSDDLRGKVLALVPALKLLRDLGSSFISKEDAASARDRILFYFKKYPNVVISNQELMIVSGISEWARRVRELRVQFGWSIINGYTAKEMAAEEKFSIKGVDIAAMGLDDYILTDGKQDRDAAFRWNKANEIRRKNLSVRDKIIEYLRLNVGKQVTGEELRYVANDKTEWARRVRELRTEYGWPIVTKWTGMPDLPVGAYLLAQDRQAPQHDRKIPDDVRREVLERDGYKCRKCGWHHQKWNPSDPRHLEAHHKQQHVKGGANTTDNLITLCNVCHDKMHRGK
jgi:hypothetical protein